MAEVDRNQVLADFQACTDIDDVEHCIAVLEQSDWDLMAAINSAMPELQSEDCVPIEEIETPGSLAVRHMPDIPNFSLGLVQGTSYLPLVLDDSSLASTSSGVPGALGGSYSPPRRMLEFSVEYRDKNAEVVLSDSETIGTLKDLLMADPAVGVPPDKQLLRGWTGKIPVTDVETLRSLNLPKYNKLFLLTPQIEMPAKLDDSSETLTGRLEELFTLRIEYIDDRKTFNLKFAGSKTVKEVKTDVYHLTNVPNRHQSWDGWPDAATEDVTLAFSGVTYPVHGLSMRKREPRRVGEAVAMVVEDGSDEDFEDAGETFPDEDFDHEDAMSHRQEPLMPNNVTTETEAAEQFMRVFSQRYDQAGSPAFYVGNLDNALRDSLQCKASERKLLAVYLHHDHSILSNVFCSQILCAESIVQFLDKNFLTWSWDLTFESNKARLLTMCTKHFGSVAANTIRNFSNDQFPLLLVITRNRSTNEVLTTITGKCSLDEVMTSLVSAVDVFKEQQQADIVEEREREARLQVKEEQDAAYHQSLKADKEKEEAKQKEQEHRMLKEMQEQAELQEQERERQQAEEEKEAISRSLADQVPAEPPTSCTEAVSNIRFRVPDGAPITRRFYAANTIQVLLNFVVSKGYHIEDFKVLTTFPRRDLTDLEDKTQTLQELKLFPQETVILEGRN